MIAKRSLYRRFLDLESLETRRLMSFGQRDGGFGNDGFAATPIQSDSTYDAREILLSGGKVVVGAGNGISRLSGAGVVDTSFGKSGKITFAGATLQAMTQDSSSRIYAAVRASAGIVVLRYTSAGKLDTSYATNGTALVTSSTNYEAQAITIQSNGKVLVAGVQRDTTDESRSTRVYRLNADGSADTSFNTSGQTDLELGQPSFLAPSIYDRVGGIFVRSDGSIAIAGGSYNYARERYDSGNYIPAAYGTAVLTVAQLSSSGALDLSFGNNGYARSEYADETRVQQARDYLLPQSAAIDSQGAIYVGGVDTTAVVAKFEDNGDLLFQTKSEDALLAKVLDIVVLSDSRAVIVCDSNDNSTGHTFAIVDDGEILNPVRARGPYAQNNTAPAIFGSYATAALSGDGDLLIAGKSGPYPQSISVGSFDLGQATDPRPDEFANARANDIAQDAFGRLHLAYYDAATTTLKYAMRDENGLWSAPRTIDGNANAGQYVAIDTDSKGNPGIAYFDGTNGDMKLALANGSQWTLRTVEGKGSVGLYPSLDFDDTDRPTMTYYKKTGGDLRFARFDPTANSFSYETVDATNDVGRSSVLVASPKTRRYSIAYADSTTGEVKWAGRKTGGVGWTLKTAATTAGGADFLSMAYGNYYEPAISYYDAKSADLKLAYFDAGQQKFITRTLATSGAVGLYSQTVFNDYYGEPLVFAYNRSGDRVFRFSTVISSPNADDAVGAAGRYLSMDLRDNRLVGSYFDAADNVLKVRNFTLNS